MSIAPNAETEIAKWLADHEADMIALLEVLVNTDSGSYYKEGVDAAGTLIKEFLEARGIPCDTIPIETHGDAVRATVSGASSGGNRPIVLMGHRDTVFPRGEPDRRPFTIRDGRAYGPGVADMKAGLPGRGSNTAIQPLYMKPSPSVTTPDGMPSEWVSATQLP